MLVVMDVVIMDAIPFTIKQSHCPNPACHPDPDAFEIL